MTQVDSNPPAWRATQKEKARRGKPLASPPCYTQQMNAEPNPREGLVVADQKTNEKQGSFNLKIPLDEA